MRKTIFGCLMILLVFATYGIITIYSGWDNATWIQKGQRIITSQVSVSSSTVTKILSANSNRVDFIIKNNNATYDLFIGSSSSVTTSNGYPISEKDTISSGGLYTGEIYGIYEAAGGTTNVPVIEAFTP